MYVHVCVCGGGWGSVSVHWLYPKDNKFLALSISGTTVKGLPLCLPTSNGWSSGTVSWSRGTRRGTAPNHNSSHYNRLIHHKTVGTEQLGHSKGVVVVMTQRSSQGNPASFSVLSAINKKAGATIKNTKAILSSILQEQTLPRSAGPAPSWEARSSV